MDHPFPTRRKEGELFCSVESSLTPGSFPTPISQHQPLDSLFPGNKAAVQSCWLQGWAGRAATFSPSQGRLYTKSLHYALAQRRYRCSEMQHFIFLLCLISFFHSHGLKTFPAGPFTPQRRVPQCQNSTKQEVQALPHVRIKWDE